MQHIHILGICGTFMGGIAAIARAAGYRVTGSDQNVYPPMSTQLRALDIELIEGYDAAQLEPEPQMILVGNVMTRGMPVIEAMLDRALPYASGPEWLAAALLRERWVQDHHQQHARLDPGRRGVVARIPDRRRTGEFRPERAARGSAILRHRGR
jgi:hypothetical protein